MGEKKKGKDVSFVPSGVTVGMGCLGFKFPASLWYG